MGKTPDIPNPGKAAAAGIAADTELQPFNYLINAASTLGKPITIDGKTYDFTGLGNADTAAKISDQMAQTLLDIQKSTAPEQIRQRIEELKTADPQGYAARKQLFDKIIEDANSHPGRPLASDLQQTVQDELAKGVGFNDAKQEEQVREGVRGQQYAQGITLGNAPTSQEAKTVVNAGESLRSQRENDALKLIQSGTAPEDVAYRQFQQSLGNLADFQSGQTPTAQFKQVSGAANVTPPGQLPAIGFNPNAAGQGVNNALGASGAYAGYQASQANPWLAGVSTAGATAGSLYKTNPSWFQTTPNNNVQLQQNLMPGGA